MIPAYEPDKKMVELVERLSENNVGILIVNDGSSQNSKKYFDMVRKKAVIVNLAENCGKGTALKTGMKNLLTYFPKCENFITADADGQHTVDDILRVRKELNLGSDFILTVRKINLNSHTPFRSQFGNKLSRYVYSVLTGHYLSDNQSGLRGFSVKHIGWLTKVAGNKYDYEMNMLYYADKQNISITTIPIETVYIDNNSSSHFDPIMDTLRIYKRLFATAWVTFASVVLVEIMMLAISMIFNYSYIYFTIPSIGLISALFKIFVNKFVVFKDVRYKDGIRTLVHTACKFCVYLIGCYIFKLGFSFIPVFISFNIIAIISIPLEYLLHKAIYVSKYNDIKKDK